MYLTLLPDSIAESAHFKKSAADWMDIFSSLTALSADRLTLAPRPSQGPLPGADPGFQVRGAALKKFWGISCEKSRFYAKKLYVFQF